MGLFDDIFDDLCPSALRIPPLQDPFPFPTISDQRPSPLEPNARTNSNIDKEAAKLTGRKKALAEAKPIGEAESNELRPIHSTPRKRQKKYDAKSVPDFVQLPRPKAKTKDEKPPPFLPISILNALHEPPPSAALFPPITPNVAPEEHHCTPSTKSAPSPNADQSQRHLESAQDDKAIADESNVNKRSYLRKRTKWSEEETYCLVKGVDRFGVGKWTKILNHPAYAFADGRTPVDLKDRFRTITGNAPFEPPKGTTYQDVLGYANGIMGNDADQYARQHEPQHPRRKKQPWSAEEDESLEKGYQKHGFCWKDIANDPSLNFSNRSGNQIRDRFRKRFPELYGEAPPHSKDSPPVALGSNDTAGSVTRSKLVNQPSDGSALKSFADIEGVKLHKQPSSASAPHDINGLLNNDAEADRQLSSRSNNWGENITLAPLLWEDLCAKPMFEID
ncbi:MAG: hypothetical protein Q9220_006820 [cf. Caloplaca sp. 1 TL-2023]